MAEPHIQYAKTGDGVSIAYWTLGEGPPLVITPSILASHLQMEWQQPEYRVAHEQLARRAQVIRYDPRGVGMSQRDALDFSVDAATLDLEAVVDRIGADRFALYSLGRAGDVAFAYAVRHPARVTAVTYNQMNPHPPVDDPVRAPLLAAIEPLVEQHWEAYTEIWQRLWRGWDSPHASSRAALMRACHTPSSFTAAYRATAQRSPAQFLADVTVPTLVLHQLGNAERTDAARLMASQIANARVAAIPGEAWFPYPNELGIEVLLDFVHATAAASDATAVPEPALGAVRTILLTDIEGHAAIMDRLGDEKGRELLREHERITRDALAAHGGTEVKAMGDGFMAWFPSAQRALECAIDLQRSIAAFSASAPETLLVRIGVNAGEPIMEADDLFGAAVIAASRICASARGGEIVVSDVVRQLVAGKNFLFADRGEVALRGFEDPVRLYELRWREE